MSYFTIEWKKLGIAIWTSLENKKLKLVTYYTLKVFEKLYFKIINLTVVLYIFKLMFRSKYEKSDFFFKLNIFNKFTKIKHWVLNIKAKDKNIWQQNVKN